MKASTEWLTSMGSEFSAGVGRFGVAPLTHYTVNYREWGEGSPLILVPGLAGGYELLGPLARLLARHFRVISYQLRGEDDCFALRRHFDLADLVTDLNEFLDSRGLERPAVLGVSFGGVLALELAVRKPGRLRALCVQGTGAVLDHGLLQRVASMVLARFPLPTDSPFVNQFFNLLFGGRRTPEPLARFVTRQCWQTDQSVMAHRFAMLDGFDIRSRLGRVRVPTLAVAGDRDLLVSPRNLAALAEGIKGSRLETLSGCGHLAFVTRPDLVAEQVRSAAARWGG